MIAPRALPIRNVPLDPTSGRPWLEFRCLRPWVSRLSLGAVLVLLSGCASLSAKRIAEKPVALTQHHPVCVQLVVAGGGKERFGGMEEAGVDEYKTALRKLIVDSKLFTGLCDDGKSALRLDVAIFKGSQKVHHIMKYEQTLPTNWRLTDPASGAVLFQERIDGVGVATDFSGATRTVNATERAMRDSMEKGMQKISGVSLKGAP